MISVGMATYNGEKFIRTQLDSVLGQSYKDFEVVICDDCSTDSTVDILAEYAEKDPRIKYFVNDKNLGFKKNFEKIMSLCKGDYIAFCDEDDEWTDDHLQVLLDVIGEKDIAGGNAELVDGDLKSLGYTMRDVLNIKSQYVDDKFLPGHLLHKNVFQGTASMITSSLKNKVLPIPEKIKFHDYWIAAVSVLENGCAYTDKVILKYRQHGNNVTTNEKFSLKLIIKGLFKQSKKKKDLIEHINFLTEVLNYAEKEKKSECSKIKDVIKYYQDTLHHKNISAVKYMLNNYDEIYYGQKKSGKIKFIRVIKKLLGL